MVDPKVVAAASIARACDRSLALCKASLILTGLSRQTRTQVGEVRRLRVQARAGRETVRRASIIARKLRAGRLPLGSVPIVIGGPGAGGSCDGCDKPLAPSQLVMQVPSGEKFVHLHADCFMIWNRLRSAGLARSAIIATAP